MRLWRGDFGTAMRVTQMKFCRRLIVVPLTTFHRLAEQIGDPRGELIFLFNTARCGSSLLTQVMKISNVTVQNDRLYTGCKRHAVTDNDTRKTAKIREK